MKKFFVIITTGILLLQNSTLAFPEEPVFAPEEHCLAYKTVKTMFFFADVDVIGKSCDVTAEMHWEESGEKAQVEVSVRMPLSAISLIGLKSRRRNCSYTSLVQGSSV